MPIRNIRGKKINLTMHIYVETAHTVLFKKARELFASVSRWQASYECPLLIDIKSTIKPLSEIIIIMSNGRRYLLFYTAIFLNISKITEHKDYQN